MNQQNRPFYPEVDQINCFNRLLSTEDSKSATKFRISTNIMEDKHTAQYWPLISKYQSLITMARRLRYSRKFIAISPSLAMICMLVIVQQPASYVMASPSPAATATLDYPAHHQYSPVQQLPAQSRAGGLEPGDYVDEAGELDVMVNQQQIPTAQLMAAAGHIVPENFFLPGGSIPALYARHHYHQQQKQQQQQQQQVDLQQVASHLHARHISPQHLKQYARQVDLMAAASAVATASQPATSDQQDSASLLDYNGYGLVSPQQDQMGRDIQGAIQGGSPTDLVEYLSPASQSALYEQQQHYLEQQLAAELAALQNQQHQQQNLDNSAQSSENSLSNQDQYAAVASSPSAALGPAYQISNNQEYSSGGSQYNGGQQDKGDSQGQQRPYGLPTKSSSREPSNMLKPLGNPKTISSPVIDFVTNQLPKTSQAEKLAEKLPQMQTPTVFSFSSSKDPSEKTKAVNQKKRNVMKQAEQLARMMIKSFNEKFGTTLGDQTDIPFLLSTLGPLGIAQNILLDPTLLVTLLNSAEKTYFSDVLPGPAKSVIRPVLNIFRVPNKKRDKGSLLNILSFLASGAPTAPAKHRQGYGVEKNNKSKNRD